MSIEGQWDREEDILADEVANGHLTQREMDRQMADIEADLREQEYEAMATEQWERW